MAVVTVGHHPELTAEEAMKVFQRHFTGKYVIYKTRLVGRDFGIKKSAWVGVSVKLKQEKAKTSFVFTYFSPSALVRGLQGAAFGLIGGLIQWLILGSSFRAIENEVKSFIESAEEFK